MANERLIHLGRQAPPSRDATGISLEPGARLYAWTPNHQQVSNCKVAVLRACRMNEGALDTTQVSYEDKMAMQEARHAELDAATRARTAQVIRRLKAEKGRGSDQTQKLERQQRLQEFNARVKSGNLKKRGPQAATEEHASSGWASATDLVLEPPCTDQQGVSTLRDWFHSPQEHPMHTKQGQGAHWHVNQAGAVGAHKHMSWNNDQDGRAHPDSPNQDGSQQHGAHQDSAYQYGANQEGAYQGSTQQSSPYQSGTHQEGAYQGCAALGEMGGQRAAGEGGEDNEEEQEKENEQGHGEEGGPALLTARARLLSHCSRAAPQQQQRARQQHASAAVAAREGLVGGGNTDASIGGSSALGTSVGPRLARVFREVPLFMQPKLSTPPPMFGGHILPRYIHLSDRSNLQRAKAKVANMGKACPPLCSCGSGASPFSPSYTASCARNCSLFGRPDIHEALLNRFLQSAGVI